MAKLNKTSLIVSVSLFIVLFPFWDYSFAEELTSITLTDSISAASVIEQAIEKYGYEAAFITFNRIKKEKKYIFNENEFNSLGYKLMSAGKIREAVVVFKMNVQLFPKSANVYDSLGESYLLSGEKDSAIVYYKKALQLNPENWNAGMKLKRMNGFIKDAQSETREICQYEPGENTGLQGFYLGQTPPGDAPKVFAPGIVSTRGNYEFCCTWSPDGREFYFNRRGIGVMVCRWEKDGWTAPELASFCEKYPGAFESHITHDGKKMFFGIGGDIWAMEKTSTEWSEANKLFPGMYATTTIDGTIYFTDISTQKEYGRIVFRQLIDGLYSDPVVLEGGVNLPVGSAHPCIAPDGSFIIFDSLIQSEKEGEEQTDLFISFRQKDGSWSDAINLGDKINTPGGNICASLSPDGKFIFYLANRDIYWVDAKIIEELKPDEL